MASEWKTVGIGTLCTGIFDGPHATPRKTDKGAVFLGISSLNGGRLDLSNVAHLSEQDFIRWTRRVTPEQGDVVFSYETCLGSVGIIPAGLRCCLGRRMALMRPDPSKVSPRYLLYAFMAPFFQDVIRRHTVHGSTVDRIPLTEFPRFPIRVPPLPVQCRIADVLGTLDDKIELNRRMNRTLEKMAAAIFKSWFIDFDPVHAKAQGRNPNLPPEIANLFPDGFEDSDLGPIPKGWNVGPLTDAVMINPKRTLAKGTLAPFLEMSNMPTRGPSPDAWRMREMTSGTKFVNGDTLVARITPCLENGKTAFVDFLHDDQVGWGSTEYIVLRPAGEIPPVFAYLLARMPSFRTFAIRQMTGSSGRQRVPPESLSKFHLAIPQPDSPVYRAFGDITQPFFNRITLAIKQNRRLAGLRDTLLPRLLSGEIEVPEVKAVAEEIP